MVYVKITTKMNVNLNINWHLLISYLFKFPISEHNQFL